MDILIPQIKGIYRDYLYRSDGSLLHDSGWRSNKIVESCHILLARLMKKDGGGIEFMRVGQGSDGNNNWVDPPLAISEWKFLQPKLLPDTMAESDIPTKCIQTTVKLSPGIPSPVTTEETYPLREFALFGSSGGQEYMIDYVAHPLIEKDSTMTLTRVIRLTF